MEDLKTLGRYSWLFALLLIIFISLIGLLCLRATQNDAYYRKAPENSVDRGTNL